MNVETNVFTTGCCSAAGSSEGINSSFSFHIHDDRNRQRRMKTACLPAPTVQQYDSSEEVQAHHLAHPINVYFSSASRSLLLLAATFSVVAMSSCSGRALADKPRKYHKSVTRVWRLRSGGQGIYTHPPRGMNRQIC